MPDFRAMVDSKSPSVKRCLFGEPDHAHVRSELVKQLEMIMDQDREKYNFDFAKGQPLTGRYQWEEVQIIPSAYAETRDVVKTPASSPKPQSKDCVRLSKADTGPSQKTSCAVKKGLRKCPAKPRAAKGKQSTLTG